MKRFQFYVFLFFLSLIYISESYAQPLNLTRMQVAGGAYHKSGQTLPLLLVSNNNGQSWSFVPTISNHPCESYEGMISEASCNDSVCSAVGSGFNQIPLLVSHDQGQTWSLVENIQGSPPSNLQILSSISCTSNACIAAGTYFNLSRNTSWPLLVKSDSRGQSWAFVQNISDLPKDLESAILTSVSCAGNVCSAVGNYKNKSDADQLLLLVSNNSGESWSFIQNNADLPPDFNSSDLIVNCIGETCIVAGNYNTTTKLPLLLVSNDKGHAWTIIKNLAGRPVDMKDGKFYSVSCTGTVCVAAGVYHEDNIYLPLLVLSKNNGKTWSIVHNILNLPTNMQAAELSSVTCSGSIWVAAGYYYTAEEALPFLPFLLVSSNSGESWTFVEKIAGFPAKSASFHAVSCTENTCTAAGEYYHTVDIDLPPPLVVSNDKGQSWTFIENIPGFPNGLKSAEVFALTAATDSKPFFSSRKMKSFAKHRQFKTQTLNS